jgi:hypothetical protein
MMDHPESSIEGERAENCEEKLRLWSEHQDTIKPRAAPRKLYFIRHSGTVIAICTDAEQMIDLFNGINGLDRIQRDISGDSLNPKPFAVRRFSHDFFDRSMSIVTADRTASEPNCFRQIVEASITGCNFAQWSRLDCKINENVVNLDYEIPAGNYNSLMRLTPQQGPIVVQQGQESYSFRPSIQRFMFTHNMNLTWNRFVLVAEASHIRTWSTDLQLRHNNNTDIMTQADRDAQRNQANARQGRRRR